MENHSTIGGDDEFQLPEEIIQHIQSFMNERGAALSTLLSKSWYDAWETRPNLVLEQHAFRRRIDEFPEFTKKTMQRYEDLNRSINTFKLRMEGNHSLATELILKAIKLGAADLTIEIPTFGTSSFVLPDEVLESKTLARLSLTGFTVDLQRRNKVVACSNLKSLNLYEMIVNGDLIRDLVSRCPSIEELKLEQITTFFGGKRSRCPFYDILLDFDKLRCLHLKSLDIKDSLSSHDFFPKAQSLVELTIWDHSSSDWNDVRICSQSLERISIRLLHNRIVNAVFDVPNIRKFAFESSYLPHLEFKTSSREWESDIRIMCFDCHPSASWFSSLNKLLRMLSLSRVSLYIYVDTLIWHFDYDSTHVGDGLDIPAVENLTLDGEPVSPAFLDALLRSCRPNFISIERRCLFGVDKENVEVFEQLGSLPWETLLDGSRQYQEGFVCFQLK